MKGLIIGIFTIVVGGGAGFLIWAKVYEKKFLRGIFALRIFANTLSRMQNTKH